MANTITLQRNVNFLYEGQLAKLELRAFGCTALEIDDDDNTVLSAHLNGQAPTILERAAYVGAVDGASSVYGELIRPAYQGGCFNRTRSVNQYLTHWIYPYRGKFHPQMVRALLNILGVRPGATVLEPYLGSGTTALEASLLGANCIGVDLSPLCAMLTRVKTASWKVVGKLRTTVKHLLDDPTLRLDAFTARGDDQRVVEFLQIARMVTLSDVSRRGRDGTSYLRKNLAMMLASVEAHAKAIKHFGLEPGNVTASVGDCRDLSSVGVAANRYRRRDHIAALFNRPRLCEERRTCIGSP